ncbi:hypothetical protein NB724_002318 [Pantoea ananatis]|nr:hypothetical protein [Pantoea ananatis]MCW0335307.1 hypothetical protein [Pantoea ananatis]MCW0382952.1 hypothetical protein [Pantoea ananatis]MCW0407616.1 hypothetical protein [Pantoea ananatis]MCW0427790.1 hypothetical protein [Pantoea ananatis]
MQALRSVQPSHQNRFQVKPEDRFEPLKIFEWNKLRPVIVPLRKNHPYKGHSTHLQHRPFFNTRV